MGTIKMSDGFAPLESARRMQQAALEHEAALAEHCEHGHLSFAEVVEDYPFEPLSAYGDFQIEQPLPATSTFGLGGDECDLSGEANVASFYMRQWAA